MAPLHSRFISVGSANGYRQNCLCMLMDTHATNQRNEAYDVGKNHQKSTSTRDTWLRLAGYGFSPANHTMNGFDATSICKANTFTIEF